MTYSFHPAAEKDVLDALDFYIDQAGKPVAERFLAELQRVAELLVQHPGCGTPTVKGRRIVPLKVFPYSIVYREIGNGIRILVVRHQHRKPGYGGARR